MQQLAFWIAALALTAVGTLLRLKGIHSPIFDHPGWRQGDTAAIARNFAQLQYNIFLPQVDYNGPPPNYVELELQIVPFLAATALYFDEMLHDPIMDTPLPLAPGARPAAPPARPVTDDDVTRLQEWLQHVGLP